jgi:hypothetical protein
LRHGRDLYVAHRLCASGYGLVRLEDIVMLKSRTQMTGELNSKT